ncbi:MAG: hypothetical protein J6I50_02780 [Clostridia bacterium]|nr:hypothetical protein [Clostridia bacterium]
MKRLQKFMMSDEPNDDSYRHMYEGAMCDVLAVPCPITVYEPIYWQEDIGYAVTEGKSKEPTQPTVTVRIPYETLFFDTSCTDQTEKTERDTIMKRLKYYLLHLTANDETYKSIYEGKMEAYSIPGGEDSDSPFNESAYADMNIVPQEQKDAVYWENAAQSNARCGVGYEYSMSNKLAKDKPTVKVRIPAEALGEVPVQMQEDDMTVSHAFSAQAAAAADFCQRQFLKQIEELNRAIANRSRPDKENGAYYYPRPGGEVMPRNAAYFAVHMPKYYENGSGIKVYIREEEQAKFKPKLYLCLTLQVQLPQKKHEKAMRMLCRDLPSAVAEFIRTFDADGFQKAVLLAEKQTEIRDFLRNSSYCAFIANGSILPRSSTGAALENALPFKAPKEAEIEISGICGMGIRRGVTVITGGGYSGKSTVLDALACGVYNHVLGDGRELVITDETAVSIAAEDGRCIKNLNISPFIKWIPNGNPADFSTSHASGSTSQAANIMEAAEYGARLLLIDEDRSATNFMIRDRLMKELIRREPITPFTDRVQELSARGISTILVIGGSGEYLSVADAVYLMDSFEMFDATSDAKRLAEKHGMTGDALHADAVNTPVSPADWRVSRMIEKEQFTSYPNGIGSEKMEISEMGYILIGAEAIDLRGLYQVLTDGQRQAIGFILRDLMIHEKEPCFSLSERLDALMQQLERDGIDSVYSSFFVNCGRFFDLPRKQDIAAVVARMRHLTYAVK